MFTYCKNNPTNCFDITGCCYYSADGHWCHDAWENLGGYQKKDAPELLYLAKNENSTVFFVDSSTEVFSVPPNGYIVYDNRVLNGGGDNNFEVYNSHYVRDRAIQSEIVRSIIEYNSLSNQYYWDRSEKSMLTEWGWHNKFYERGKYQNSAQSVNFDMGTFSNSSIGLFQKMGYYWDRKILPFFERTQTAFPVIYID